MLKKTTLAALMLAIVLMALSACDASDGPGSQWLTLDEARWAYGDTLVFTAPTNDSAAVGDIVLTVRHTEGYPYANLWLEVGYNHADTLTTDTFNIVLADEFGHWYGQGNGVTFQHTDTLRPKLRIDRASSLRLRHVMRIDTLTEIEQIGIAY